MVNESMHWADQAARRIISEKGDKKSYVCASGITPSGIVHIGNFREIITVDLVTRALRDLGKEVRFIYSWDDYDTFRKVPEGIPGKELLKSSLRKPIVDIPDPFGKEKSYARHFEMQIEKALPKLGINPEFIYQSTQYRKCIYSAEIRKAIEKASEIREILDKYREEPLPKEWLPVSIFDPDTKTDEVSEIRHEGSFKISYTDKNNNRKTFDFSKDGRCKLLWRVDWPMRWAYEKVDFEPGGKDHSTEGGSYTTAKDIAKEIYGREAPIYIMYDFITIKGMPGKISSSRGNVVTVDEALEIYEPSVLRYLFAGTRPDTEFAISFDLDVIKIYEDFDRVERIYYGNEKIGEKEERKQERIYEFSCPGKPSEKMPLQPGFRHLTTILQIYSLDEKKTMQHLKDSIKNANDEQRLAMRLRCARNWLEKYTPDEMKFEVAEKPAKLTDMEARMLSKLAQGMKEGMSEEELSSLVYATIKDNKASSADFFKACYRAIINKEKGPKLVPFILAIGIGKIKNILGKEKLPE